MGVATLRCRRMPRVAAQVRVTRSRHQEQPAAEQQDDGRRGGAVPQGRRQGAEHGDQAAQGEAEEGGRSLTWARLGRRATRCVAGRRRAFIDAGAALRG
eukprot:358367-Chlamydomonas_euryale.AAC.4